MSERDHRLGLLWRHDGLHCNIVAKRLYTVQYTPPAPTGAWPFWQVLQFDDHVSNFLLYSWGFPDVCFLPAWPLACALRPYIVIAFSAIYIASIRVGIKLCACCWDSNFDSVRWVVLKLKHYNLVCPFLLWVYIGLARKLCNLIMIVY